MVKHSKHIEQQPLVTAQRSDDVLDAEPHKLVLISKGISWSLSRCDTQEVPPNRKRRISKATQNITDLCGRPFRQFGLSTATRELPEQPFCTLFIQLSYRNVTFDLPNIVSASEEEGDRLWKRVVEPRDFTALHRLKI